MSIKRKTSKYYIHKEINLLLIKLIHIKNLFNIYKKIYFKNGYELIYKTFPKTSSIVLQTIIDRIILELSCLVVDKNDEDLCIRGFISKYYEYEKDYREKRYVYIRDADTGKKHRLYIETSSIKEDMGKLDAYLKDNVQIRKYLKKYRDKTIAHNDKKLNFKPKYKYDEMKIFVTYDQMEEYIEQLYCYMNDIYSTLYKTQFIYMDEFDWELSYLNKLIEKEKIKRYKNEFTNNKETN